MPICHAGQSSPQSTVRCSQSTTPRPDTLTTPSTRRNHPLYYHTAPTQCWLALLAIRLRPLWKGPATLTYMLELCRELKAHPSTNDAHACNGTLRGCSQCRAFEAYRATPTPFVSRRAEQRARNQVGPTVAIPFMPMNSRHLLCFEFRRVRPPHRPSCLESFPVRYRADSSLPRSLYCVPHAPPVARAAQVDVSKTPRTSTVWHRRGGWSTAPAWEAPASASAMLFCA
jgi:hypothetical protein